MLLVSQVSQLSGPSRPSVDGGTTNISGDKRFLLNVQRRDACDRIGGHDVLYDQQGHETEKYGLLGRLTRNTNN